MKSDKQKIENRPSLLGSKKAWGERHTFVTITFLIAALNYAQRFNLSIGIVAMVHELEDEPYSPNLQKSSTSPHRQEGEMCPLLLGLESNEIPPNPNLTLTNNLWEEPLPKSSDQLDTNQNAPTFPWNERDQGLILGSFFWGYVLSQIPSGILAQKYGGKWIIAVSMLATAFLSICLPQAAVLGGRDYVIGVRILQGIAEGFVVPAMLNMQAKWTPAEERARLSAICFAGFPFGTSMTMLMSGFVIPEYGWPSVFYIPGLVTIFIVTIWVMKIHASPAEHPHITADELMYITNSIGCTSRDDPGQHVKDMEYGVGKDGGDGVDNGPGLGNVPWREIICSTPVWAGFISQFCCAWGHNMLKSEGPKYLHSALHFNIHQNSYVAASPYLAQVLFTMSIGRMSDFLQERKLISMLTARKLCNTIGQWGTAMAFLGIIISGCNRTPAVICYILSGMINGAMDSGTFVNIVDITPNYAGLVEGVINSIANVAGFGAPYLAGLILYHEHSIIGWGFVFGVPVIMNIVGNLAFLIWAEVKVQSWNDSSPKMKPELEVVR